MTFSGGKKTFPGELPEQATYPVPQSEACASQRRSGLLFDVGGRNYVVVGKTGAGKTFCAPSKGALVMKSRLINIGEGVK